MLSFKNVTVTKGKRNIIENVSFLLKPHTVTAVIGRNGSGKTTLISCLAQENKYKGTVLFGDRDIRMMSLGERAKSIAFLPQILPEPQITVEELVRLGRTPYLDLGGSLNAEDSAAVNKAIEDMGIDNLRHRYLSEISGGEKQKAYIAMVLAQNTRVIVFDEPTTYLDMKHEKEFSALLEKLRSEHKKTILVVMHDITRALEVAQNIALIHEGKLRFFGSAKDCADSGLIEEVFSLDRISYKDSQGNEQILFR